MGRDVVHRGARTNLQIFCKSTPRDPAIPPGTSRDEGAKTFAEIGHDGTPRDTTAHASAHLKSGDPQGSGGSNPSPSVLSRSAAERVRSAAEELILLSGVFRAAQRRRWSLASDFRSLVPSLSRGVGLVCGTRPARPPRGGVDQACATGISSKRSGGTAPVATSWTRDSVPAV